MRCDGSSASAGLRPRPKPVRPYQNLLRPFGQIWCPSLRAVTADASVLAIVLGAGGGMVRGPSPEAPFRSRAHSGEFSGGIAQVDAAYRARPATRLPCAWDDLLRFSAEFDGSLASRTTSTAGPGQAPALPTRAAGSNGAPWVSTRRPRGLPASPWRRGVEGHRLQSDVVPPAFATETSGRV